MCFSTPKVTMPETVQAATIRETSAPEPQAVVFGGSDPVSKEIGVKVEGTRKKGTGSLTIKRDPVVADTTGANRALNTSR